VAALVESFEQLIVFMRPSAQFAVMAANKIKLYINIEKPNEQIE
jgi:hypothetical protein